MPQHKTRFDGVDFSASRISPLHPDHHISSDRGFRCVRGEFRTYWKKNVTRETSSSMGKCWVIVEDGHLAAYITLLADKLSTANEGIKLLTEEGIKHQTYPAVKIGLLAADERAKGAGTRIVDWALDYIATELVPRLGIRFVTVDALYDEETGYDASIFYQQKWGFNFVGITPAKRIKEPYRTMYLDIKPISQALLK